MIEYLPDGVPENSKSAEYAYGCSGSLEDAVRVVSKYKRVRDEPGDDPFYEFHAPTICRETKEHGLCDLGRRYNIEEGCTSVLIPYNPCFRIFWRGRNDESTWHASKPVKNEWSLDAFINGCTAPENSLNGSGSPESRTCIRLGASLDHLVPWFGWLYAMQWFGYGHLLLLQAALHLLCRLLFLRFDVGYHATGSELCWHLVRGFAWFAGTCTILTARASCTKKRLQIVQKRRFSIPVLREHRNRQHFGWVMAIAILNNHFVALAHLQSHDMHITQLQTGTVFGTMSSVPGANGSLRADIQGCQPHHFDRGGDLHHGLIPVVRPPQNTHAQLSSSTIDLNFHAIGADGEGRAIVALASETTNEATRIVIYGHQFKDRAHGPRHTRSLSFRPSVVQLQARALWEDFCTQEPCPVYMLEQQPIQRAQHLEVHFIVELTIRQEAYNYALVDVLVEENFLRRTTIAMHHLTAVTDAIDAIFPGEACQPNGIHLCMVEHDGRRYRRSDEVHIPHASYMHVHRCSLATSFNFHPNIFGLHDVATIVYEKGPGFTAEIFRIRHHVKGRRGASQCVSEFRGQDLLSPDTFLQGISCIDIESTVGGLVADNNTNRHDEEIIEFQFSWEHLDSDEDVMHDEVHLQQTGISTIVQAPKVPDVVFRYDPDEFDQERDTVLDEATYPIPETPNDELDLPPRHRWRNYQALRTAIQTVRATHPDVFRLDTYGLRNRYISNRIIEVFSTDMGTIMRSIATTWAEYALGEHMNVYFVSPQPADTPPATITLVIEFPTQEWDFMVSRAVLIDSFVDNIPAGRQAEYIDAQSPARGVALATGYRPRCRPSGVDYCYVTSRGSSFLLHEEIWANHGDYKLFHLDSFEIINAQVLVNFPSGRAFATDFRWRSNHYNQQGFTLHIYSIAGQDRAAPIHLERDITNFLDINFLWQQVLEATSHIGTTDRSVLHQVWPQNVYHASQSAIHLVLDVFPNFPMTPVLVSIVVQAGGQRAERIETRAHQLPPRISILHFMGLVGYSSFAQHFAVDACVSHAGRQFCGENHTLQLTVGGNYELRIQTPPFVDFIHSVANTVQRLETVPAEESESDRPTPDSENDDMDLSQRSLRTHSPFGISLLQTAMLLISPHLAATSFTESFINRSWPLTTRGEDEVAAATGIDVNLLRARWGQIAVTYGLPRPLGIESYVLHRPPSSRIHVTPFELLVARFDDPVPIPAEIGNHWVDLNSAAWRVFPCHESTSTSRTWEGHSATHFMLLQGRETSSLAFRAGLIEVVARASEDESSLLFGVVLPSRLTWLHIWNWLRIGHGFHPNNIYTVECNGVPITNPLLFFHVDTGFYLQICIVSRSSADFVGIPQGKARMMSGSLFQGLPSAVGTVYLAGFSLSTSDKARLSFDQREQAILNKWPFLEAWSRHRLHTSARAREPPWQVFVDATIVNPTSDGTHVAVLAAVFEGGGCVEHAIVLHQQANLHTLYSVLECAFRCMDVQYLCVTTINGLPAPLITPLNVQNGDYVEVFIARKTAPELLTHVVDVAEDGSLDEQHHQLQGHVGRITGRGMYPEDNLDLRSDAMPAEPLFAYGPLRPLRAINCTPRSVRKSHAEDMERIPLQYSSTKPLSRRRERLDDDGS